MFFMISEVQFAAKMDFEMAKVPTLLGVVSVQEGIMTPNRHKIE
jgi:hypothetical protein